MSGASNVGDLVESIVFTATNLPVVISTIAGSTVGYLGAGQYAVTLDSGNQIDPTQRAATVTVGENLLTLAKTAQALGNTDQLLGVTATDLLGVAADTGAELTVMIWRISN